MESSIEIKIGDILETFMGRKVKIKDIVYIGDLVYYQYRYLDTDEWEWANARHIFGNIIYW